MKKLIVTLLIVFTFCDESLFSQQIPVGTCGILYFYDATGCRTKRMYYCNNGGPYPQGRGAIVQTAENESAEFEEVDALFPNPTTGQFYVTFSKVLKGAAVNITDVSGKVITQFRASGNRILFDLSGKAAGVYYVRIEEEGKVISKKVVKQ